MADMAVGNRPSWLWLAVGFAALAGGFLIYLAAGSSASPAPSADAFIGQDRPPVVEYSIVRSADPTFKVTAPGRLEARQTLTVVGEVPGKISSIHPNLEVGGRINQSEVLFRIDQRDYRTDLNRAEAQLATALATLQQANADRNRQVELAEIGAVPAAQSEAAIASLANAEANVAQAQSQVTLAQSNLAKTSVRAPFDAIVVSEVLSPDTYVAPGVPLAELIDASAGEIQAGLSPSDVSSVRRAQTAAAGGAIIVRAVPNDASVGDLPLMGTLASFSPTIDPTSRTVSVRAVFPEAFSRANDGRVFAGDFMSLEIDARADRPIYELPTSALRREREVWIVAEQDTLRSAPVSPVESRGTFTLVTSPIDLAGQRVMTTPLAEETENMSVRPRNALAQERE